MSELLSAAFSLAERVAFRDMDGARASRNPKGGGVTESSIRELWLRTAMRVDPAVAPGLSKSLAEVCAALNIPPGHVEVYIVADAEIQARCVAHRDQCLVQLTSGLVNLMEPAELKFVIGHEIGHWLLKHGACESNRESRAREISADRIGLLACGEIRHATHAVMKHTSGLSSEHIRFDVVRFIAQLEDVRTTSGPNSTHPANVVRCKALISFDTAVRRGLSPSALLEANKQVAADFARFQDGHHALLLKQYEMWNSIMTMVRGKNSFSKDDQALFENKYGADNLVRMKGFLKLCSPSSVEDDIMEKINALKEQLD